MKKKLLLTLLSVVLTGSLFAQQTLLATWTFTDLVDAPNTPLTIPSNTDIGLQTGTAHIYADGTNGSSLLTSISNNPDITAFSGSIINDPRTPPSADMALAIAGSTINGSHIVLKFSTTGYQNIVLSFATRGTGTGFDSHVWSYSTDGVNFTTIDGNNTASRSSSFTLATVDLSAFSAINDQPTVYLRLTVDGANSGTGNNRFDNIQINSTPAGDDTYMPYVTNSEVIDSTHATITFSEAMNTTAAELVTNYSFTGGYSVSSATLTTDNTVTLTITPALAIDNNYSLTIHSMEDLAGNNMADTSVTLVYGTSADCQFATLAAVRNAATGATVYKYTGEAVVTFTAANRNQKYIQDGTAALVIDDNDGRITSALTVGDKITNFYFTLTNYNGLLQATPTADCAAISSGNDVYDPIIVTISELTTNYDLYESELITLPEVTFAAGTFTTTSTSNINISQGDDAMECRNQFRTLDTTIAEGFTANLTGFVLRYNSTIQIAPRNHSDIEEFVSTPTVEAPIFSIPGGNYYDATTVSISTATEDATIHYTIDGSTPTASSPVYTTAINIDTTTTLKAIAIKAEWNDSPVMEATYTIIWSPTIDITTPTNSVVFLTTESFRPTFTIENFTIGTTGLLKIEADFLTSFGLPTPFYCTTNDMLDIILSTDISLPVGEYSIVLTLTNLDSTLLIPSVSESRSFSFVQPVVSNPVFTPTAGNYNNDVTVSIACETENAAIYYTLDGSIPDENATLYANPIMVSTTTTIKAIALMEDWISSEIVDAEYIITGIVEEEMIYQTGFESSEGFIASQTYNNNTVSFTGNSGEQWGTYFGTPSATSPIAGAQSMQMRWYTSSATSLGYTYTNFILTNPTRVTFLAENTNGLNIVASFSIDGGATYQGDSLFTLSTSATTYEYLISEIGQYEFVQLRFAMSLPATTPTGTPRIYLDNVIVYGFPELPSSTVSAPIISPNAQFCYEPTTITITCPTDSAEIRYTTDGSVPTESSMLYTEPFVITGTTTVKAQAWKDNLIPSFVVSTDYKFPVEVADIAAFKAANSEINTNVYKITGDVAYVFKGDNRYIYIQDNSGALLIYDVDNTISNTYSNGDVISNGIYGTYTLYHGLPQLIPTKDIAASTENNGAIESIAVTMEDLLDNYADYESQLVTISNATFEAGTFGTANATSIGIVQGNDSMYCRNTYKTLNMTIEVGAIADITGFVNIYDQDYQISPRENNDITICAERVKTPVFSPENITVTEPSADYVDITITCETPDAVIYYTLDGSTPDQTSTLYEGVFQLYTQGVITAKAIAYHPDMCQSDVASAIYDFGNSIREYQTLPSIFPNPTSSSINIDLTGMSCQQIEIFNLVGKLLHSIDQPTGVIQINMTDYSSGIYLLKVTTATGVATGKVVKQ